eukprot:1185588-Prorocentrum_minimum.AAC.1
MRTTWPSCSRKSGGGQEGVLRIRVLGFSRETFRGRLRGSRPRAWGAHLEDLAGDVEGQVGGVNDALDKLQVARHQLLAKVVADEDALHKQLDVLRLGVEVLRSRNKTRQNARDARTARGPPPPGGPHRRCLGAGQRTKQIEAPSRTTTNTRRRAAHAVFSLRFVRSQGCSGVYAASPRAIGPIRGYMPPPLTPLVRCERLLAACLPGTYCTPVLQLRMQDAERLNYEHPIYVFSNRGLLPAGRGSSSSIERRPPRASAPTTDRASRRTVRKGGARFAE